MNCLLLDQGTIHAFFDRTFSLGTHLEMLSFWCSRGGESYAPWSGLAEVDLPPFIDRIAAM